MLDAGFYEQLGDEEQSAAEASGDDSSADGFHGKPRATSAYGSSQAQPTPQVVVFRLFDAADARHDGAGKHGDDLAASLSRRLRRDDGIVFAMQAVMHLPTKLRCQKGGIGQQQRNCDWESHLSVNLARAPACRKLGRIPSQQRRVIGSVRPLLL
jgi:hypothetical protein